MKWWTTLGIDLLVVLVFATVGRLSHAEGAADYLRILERFTLEELSARCDVSVEDMQFLTGMLIQDKPTSMLLGWGMHRHGHHHGFGPGASMGQ